MTDVFSNLEQLSVYLMTKWKFRQREVAWHPWFSFIYLQLSRIYEACVSVVIRWQIKFLFWSVKRFWTEIYRRKSKSIINSSVLSVNCISPPAKRWAALSEKRCAVCGVRYIPRALLFQSILLLVLRRYSGNVGLRENAGAGREKYRYVLNCSQKMNGWLETETWSGCASREWK